MAKYKLISVYSLTLLQKLSEANCLGLLKYVNHDDNYDYPTFKFWGKPDVSKVIDDFNKEFGKDSRDIDDTKLWQLYSKPVVGEKEIKTKNKNVVSEAIKAGYGATLRRVYVDQAGRKIYCFVYTPEVAAIKNRWHENTKAVMFEKQKEG